MRTLCGLAWMLAVSLPGAAAGQPEPHHHHAEKSPGYARLIASYRLPDTALVRSDGAEIRFPKEIDDGRPVVLNFIYTSCTAVCPILSHSLAEFQRKLGAERGKVQLVSISIDPEEDTPERLATYAERFGARGDWRFYTGSLHSSVSLQKAFHAYFGNKMHHRPMTFMRLAPGKPWVRLEGFATPEDLLKEYRKLAAR